MKKYSLIFIFAITLFSLNTASYAEITKIITLKDGSILKGKVIELKDGIYTFETSNLGNINISKSDVLSIASPETLTTSSERINGVDDAQKAQLKRQVEQIQGTILADEEITTEIQKIVEDDEIRSMLSDPNLLNDMMSFDQNKIQQNESVQDLMNNPKIQNLMNKIQKKITAQ